MTINQKNRLWAWLIRIAGQYSLPPFRDPPESLAPTYKRKKVRRPRLFIATAPGLPTLNFPLVAHVAVNDVATDNIAVTITLPGVSYDYTLAAVAHLDQRLCNRPYHWHCDEL